MTWCCVKMLHQSKYWCTEPSGGQMAKTNQISPTAWLWIPAFYLSLITRRHLKRHSRHLFTLSLRLRSNSCNLKWEWSVGLSNPLLPLPASLLWLHAELLQCNTSVSLFLAMWQPLRNWASGMRELPVWSCESMHCLPRSDVWPSAVFALSRSWLFFFFFFWFLSALTF